MARHSALSALSARHGSPGRGHWTLDSWSSHTSVSAGPHNNNDIIMADDDSDNGNSALLAAVELKIRDKEWHVKEKKGSRSEAWKKFGVVVKGNGDSTEFVACFQCTLVKKYDSKRGTNVLLKHNCQDLRRRDDNDVTIAAKLSAPLKKPLPSVKEEFKDTEVDLCAGTLSCTFGAVSSPYFVDVIQKAVDFGHAYGRLDAKELCATSKTLSKGVSDRADRFRLELLPELEGAIKQKSLAATFDLWTDKYKNFQYSTVTAHYITVTFKLKSRVLFTCKFSENRETMENILQEVYQRFAEVQINEEDVKDITFVTDGGANVKAALKDFLREYCIAHNLNRVLFHLFSVKLTAINYFGTTDFPDVLELCLSLYTFLKTSGLNRKLGNPIKFTAVEKARRGKLKLKYPIVKSIYERLDKIKLLMQKIPYVPKDLKKKFMKLESADLANFLPILEAVESGVSCKGIVSSSVWASLETLLSPDEDDSLRFASLKRHLREELGVLEAMDVIDRCKNLVTFFKHSKLMAQLSSTLKQEVETRWNSAIDMLLSVLKVYDEVEAILQTADEVKRRLLPPRAKIQEVVDFLKPFQVETDALQGDSYPTIQKVALSIRTLMDHCQNAFPPSSMTKRLRERGLHELRTRVKLSMTHKIGAFLWPRCRKLTVIPTEQREEVKQEIQRLCAAMPEPEKDPAEEPPAKAPRLSEAQMRYCELDEDDDSNEIDAYLQEKIGECEDLLQWWKDRQFRFPRLCKLALRILAIPASSASSERQFSLAGFLLNQRRSSLSPDLVNDMLFLNNALKHRGAK